MTCSAATAGHACTWPKLVHWSGTRPGLTRAGMGAQASSLRPASGGELASITVCWAGTQAHEQLLDGRAISVTPAAGALPEAFASRQLRVTCTGQPTLANITFLT